MWGPISILYRVTNAMGVYMYMYVYQTVLMHAEIGRGEKKGLSCHRVIWSKSSGVIKRKLGTV